MPYKNVKYSMHANEKCILIKDGDPIKTRALGAVLKLWRNYGMLR